MTATEQQTLEFVDGGIARAGESALVRHARRLPLGSALMNWGPLRHAASARKLGARVRESVRFVAADLAGVDGIRRYHLRRGGRPVLLRHGTVDVWTFGEIFELRLYEPPAAVTGHLEATEAPLVLDLGGNIGLFGVDVLTRHPGARVVAYEPEPENAAIHRRLIEISGAGAQWHLVEACAGTHDGTVTFMPGKETGSHVVEGPAAGTVEVPMVDVMPRLAEADLVKIDIEGGEWPLLEHPDFTAARAVVLEYHPHGCPGDNPRLTAHELLEGHGFGIAELFHEPESRVGMLWATRG